MLSILMLNCSFEDNFLIDILNNFGLRIFGTDEHQATLLINYIVVVAALQRFRLEYQTLVCWVW